MAYVKPITPADIAPEKARRLPPAVIEAWNELIAENWDGVSSSSFKRDDAIYRIMDKMSLDSRDYIDRQKVTDMRWLDVETIYESRGWVVELNNHDAVGEIPLTYTFTAKEKEE
jgi:hypothetical protein